MTQSPVWSLASSLGALVAHYTTIFTVTSTVGVAILVWLHYHYKNVYSYWPNKGIKGPKPWPVFGNVVEFLWLDRMTAERKWLKQWGKMYGIYFGSDPILVVADPEVARQISIRDFDVFPNHELFEFTNKHQRDFIFFMRDDNWKRVRTLMSPTFTSGKIKRMFKLLDLCANDLIDCIDEQVVKQPAASKGVVVNAKDCFSLYTMDGIASCCYGLKLERFGASNVKEASSRNDFVAVALKLFELNIARMIFMFSVPKFLLKKLDFELTSSSLVEPLARRTGKIIEMRRKLGTTKKFDDYLQILLDAELDDQLELNEMDAQENHHAALTKDSLVADQKRLASEVMSQNGSSSLSSSDGELKRPKKLTDNELLSSAMFLLIVGVETTGSLLTSCVCLLAFFPDIQQRLHDKLKPISNYDPIKKKFVFEYESLTSCDYLDSVISETLRFFPPITRTDRVANQDYVIDKYNIHLPKCSKIALGICEMMSDPDNWNEPDKFNPDRFMPGNREHIVPGSYCPFGLGPRHCLGMRFSLTEAKLALAKLVMSYRFEPAPGAEYPPRPKFNFGLNSPKTPLVKMVPRD